MNTEFLCLIPAGFEPTACRLGGQRSQEGKVKGQYGYWAIKMQLTLILTLTRFFWSPD